MHVARYYDLDWVKKHRSKDANSVCCPPEAAPIAKLEEWGRSRCSPKDAIMGHDVEIFMPYGFLPDKMAIPERPVWCGSAMFSRSQF